MAAILYNHLSPLSPCTHAHIPPPPSHTYTHTHQDNEYVQAIKSVASVLAPYDSDQLIPTFGFGARVPPDGQVSHCFPLNFNYQKPDVYGVQVSVCVHMCVCVCACVCVRLYNIYVVVLYCK